MARVGIVWVVFGIALVFVVGCKSKGNAVGLSPSSPQAPPGPAVVFVDTNAGVELTGDGPAGLVAYYGVPSVYEFRLTVGAGRDPLVWSLVARLKSEDVAAGGGTFTLALGPVYPQADGQATINLSGLDGGAPVVSQNGQLSITLGKGTMSGTVAADSPALSGSFHGALSVACYVPPSPGYLDSGAPVATHDTDAGLVFDNVIDPDLSASFCADLRAYSP